MKLKLLLKLLVNLSFLLNWWYVWFCLVINIGVSVFGGGIRKGGRLFGKIGKVWFRLIVGVFRLFLSRCLLFLWYLVIEVSVKLLIFVFIFVDMLKLLMKFLKLRVLNVFLNFEVLIWLKDVLWYFFLLLVLRVML